MWRTRIGKLNWGSTKYRKFPIKQFVNYNETRKKASKYIFLLQQACVSMWKMHSSCVYSSPSCKQRKNTWILRWFFQLQQQWLTEECGKRWVVFFNNIKMIFDTNAKRIAFQINIKRIGSQSESLVGLCALSWRFCQVLNTNNNCNRTVITTIDD